jgi:hypothetical protein
VRGVQLDVVVAHAIPEPRALRHRTQRGAHQRGIEAHDPVGARIAARRAQQIYRLGAWLERAAGVTKQLQGRLNQQLDVPLPQQLIRRGVFGMASPIRYRRCDRGSAQARAPAHR